MGRVEGWIGRTETERKCWPDLSPAANLVLGATANSVLPRQSAQWAKVWEAASLETVSQIALRNHVAAPVGHGLANNAMSIEPPAVLAIRHAEARVLTSNLLDELDRVAQLGEREGCSPILVEHGAALLLAASCHGCSESSALDIVIDEEGMDPLARALGQNGFGRTEVKRGEAQFAKVDNSGRRLRTVLRRDAIHRTRGARINQPSYDEMLKRCAPPSAH